MIRRFLLLDILVMSCLFAAAQGRGFVRPDYKHIEQETKNPNSQFFYSRLFDRYTRDDTTLSQEEIRMLYYGFFFQDAYNQFNPSYYSDSIKALYKKGSLSVEDKKKIISYAKADLKFSPFKLSDLNALCTIYFENGDMANYNLYKFKFRAIAQAILGTGDGRKTSTGFHVLEVSDEYTIMAALGLEAAGYKTYDDVKCDFIEAKENSQGIKGLYFDVRQIFEGYYNTPKHNPDGSKK